MNTQSTMFGAAVVTAMPQWIWLPVVAYPLLQVLALVKSRGRFRLVAAMPVLLMLLALGAIIEFHISGARWSRSDSFVLLPPATVSCAWTLIIVIICCAAAGADEESSMSRTERCSNTALRWFARLGIIALAVYCVFAGLWGLEAIGDQLRGLN